ncbi:MAG: hypothetical protein ACRD3C_06860 [Vicinamibacterales bacterium]
MGTATTDVLALFLGIALCAAVIVLLDWWGRRKYRQSRHRPGT